MPLTPQQLHAAMRRIATGERTTARRTVVHRGTRPRIVLDVQRQPVEDDQQCPPAGTLTIDPAAGTAVLHACRRKHWDARHTATLVQQLRGVAELVICAHTQIAAERTRRALNLRWRLLDIADSGLFTDSTNQILRRT